MSKLAITGNDSGSGTFTIAAPNSDTDRTLTLPDEAGTVLTSASDIDGRLLKIHTHDFVDSSLSAVNMGSYATATGSSFTYTPVSSDSFIIIEGFIQTVFDSQASSGDNYNKVTIRLDIDGSNSTATSAWYRQDGADRAELGQTLYLQYFAANTSTSNKTISLEYIVNVSGQGSEAGINDAGGDNEPSYIVVKEYSGSVTTATS